MTLDEAKTLWRNAPARLAPENVKHFDGTFTGPVIDGVPQWNPGKGGRVWCEVQLDINLFEALIVTGREQIPDTEVGYRWYRAHHGIEAELEDEDDEIEEMDQPFDDSPMTAVEAKEVLEMKANGSFRPALPDRDTELVEVVGETCLEELEAYFLLWKDAKAAV